MIQEQIDILKLIVVIAIMIPACISDWRKREANDIFWIVLGSFGLIMMCHTASSFRSEYVLMVIGTAMILLDILWEKERSTVVSIIFYVIMAAMFIVPVATSFDDPVVRQFLVVPVSFVIFLAMFSMGMIKGGADAKCLITLAAVFQTYPSFGSFPMITVPGFEISLVFMFPLMVLFHASLMSLFVGVYYVALNVKNRDIELPYMLTGFKMDIKDIKGSHVWPMQYVDNGNIVNTMNAQDPSVLVDLEKVGAEQVWVTAMIPFLIPITAAVIFITFIGNLLFLLPF